jgi:GDP-L-fucose synthase
MKKIAVLGANGFVGSSLTKFLSQSYQVTPVTRRTLDMLDPMAVKVFLYENEFDVILNCAAKMTDDNKLDDARNNLGMFMNFYNNSNLFGKFINTGSGAEFDRSLDISNVEESSLFYRMPKDSYGWGQNIKSRLCVEKLNFYNLRIFNCFGKGEIPTRIFPKILERSISKEILEIKNDRYFDYFSIQDLCIVVDNFIINDHQIKDVNCVYMKKYKISEIVEKFCKLNSITLNYNISDTSEHNYTGHGGALNSLNIRLDGLAKGLSDYVQN